MAERKRGVAASVYAIHQDIQHKTEGGGMNTETNKHSDSLSYTLIQTHLSLQLHVSYHHRKEQINGPVEGAEQHYSTLRA